MNAVGKGDKLDMALKGAYNADKYSVIATLGQAGKVRQQSLACRPAGWLGYVFTEPSPALAAPAAPSLQQLNGSRAGPADV